MKKIFWVNLESIEIARAWLEDGYSSQAKVPLWV